MDAPPGNEQTIQRELVALCANDFQAIRFRGFPVQQADQGTCPVGSTQLQAFILPQLDGGELFRVDAIIHDLNDGIGTGFVRRGPLRLVAFPLLDSFPDGLEFEFLVRADLVGTGIILLGKYPVIFAATQVSAETVMVGNPHIAFGFGAG